MTDNELISDPVLDDIADACARSGYLSGEDYAIWGRLTDMSSEVIELGLDGDEYVAWRRERGQRWEILRSSNTAQIKIDFLAAVARFAASSGRGPCAKTGTPNEFEGMTSDQMLAKIRRDQPRSRS